MKNNYHYFVPMLVEEFHNLFRLGSIRIPQNRWLYSSPNINTPYSYESSFFEDFKEIAPSFEDTINVVIVEFSTCRKPKKHAFPEFDFQNAVATYALTDHDQDVLKSRFSRASKLSSRLLIDEKAIQLWNQKLFEKRSLDGAQSLLKIFGWDNTQFKDDELALLEALNLRKNNFVSPIKENSSYLDNLICYSRSGPIPNIDTGFLQDCAHILAYSLLPNKPEPFGVKEAIEQHKSANSTLADIVGSLSASGIARRFDEYAALPGALVSSLTFLKLCHLIREHNESLSREKLRGLLSSINDHNSVARGVWWCGGFWGFTQFAEEYYAVASLPESLDYQSPSENYTPVQSDIISPDKQELEPISSEPEPNTDPPSAESITIPTEAPTPEINEFGSDVPAEIDDPSQQQPEPAEIAKLQPIAKENSVEIDDRALKRGDVHETALTDRANSTFAQDTPNEDPSATLKSDSDQEITSETFSLKSEMQPEKKDRLSKIRDATREKGPLKERQESPKKGTGRPKKAH